MAGAQYFTKLDASNAFWQIKVDEENSKLLALTSPCGRFRFLRILYGIHNASVECQARTAAIVESIKGCWNIQDGIIIIIWVDTPKLLEKRIIEVMQAVRRSELKLNRSKCQFNQHELTFLGHTISNKGIAPDARKIEVITDMPQPTNQKELQRFLGMITYLGNFFSNLSTKTAPLRLLKTLFGPLKSLKEAHLKEMITQSPTLKYFDPKLPIKVSSDASTQRLGTLLEQLHDNEWHPIAYASRFLTSAEIN